VGISRRVAEKSRYETEEILLITVAGSAPNDAESAYIMVMRLLHRLMQTKHWLNFAEKTTMHHLSEGAENRHSGKDR
jgi:hypothetical protein